MRSLTHAGYRYIDERVKGIFKGAAATGGCKVNVTTTSLEKDCLSSAPPEGAPGPCTFPPTVNSPDAYRVAKGAAVGLVGSERFIEATPTMGGEDFAYLLEQVPGAMVFLGIGNATKHTNVNLHNPRCAHLARHTHIPWARETTRGPSHTLALTRGPTAVLSADSKWTSP